MAHQETINFDQLRQDGYTLYANVLVMDSLGRVLLARRAEEPGAGLWSLPGGHVEQDDASFEAAARRELSEELGVEAGKLLFLGEASYPDRHMASALYLHQLLPGDKPENRDPQEHTEIRQFAVDDALALDEKLIPGLRRVLANLAQARRVQEQPET